jgi:hypothetical protein
MKASLLVTRNQLPFYCGPKDGGAFDLTNACPTCGTGARRLEPIKLPGVRLKDRVSCTLKFEIVIPPRLVVAIRSTAPHCLREIRDDQTGEATAFFQLIPDITLPRWGVETTGWCTSEMDPPCPICKRDGYFNVPKTPLKISYDQPVPTFALAETCEHFGKSRLQADFRKSLFASPYIIVSEAVEGVLSGEPGVEFVPVNFSPSRATEDRLRRGRKMN